MAMLMAVGFTALLIGSIALVSETLVGNFDKVVAALAGKSMASSAAGTPQLAQIVTISRSYRAVAHPSVMRRQADWLLAA
jgi:hypothetical protein